MIKALIFDWGDTIMRDYALDGPMYEWAKVDWIPGAKNLLKAVQGKFVCIIATSADHSGAEDMIKALKRIGAEQYFRFFYAQKDLGYKKPDPRFFRAVVEKAGITSGEAVMIGNSYEKDIIGAKAVGLKTIFFNEHNVSGSYSHADAIVTSMNDINGELISKL